MFSKYFLQLCALVFLAVSIDAVPVEETEVIESEENEERNPALAIAMRVIAQAFKWAAKHCIKDAANHCKQHWKHIHALKDCAKGYLHANKGRCVVG